MTFAADYLSDVQSHLADASEQELRAVCEQIAYMQGRGRIHLFGNGASFAIALHVATDLTKTCGVVAEAYGNTAWLTMAANDFGFDAWMAQTLEHYADMNDTAIFVSSSGMSPNVLRGARQAREMGVHIITLSGMNPSNSLRALGDVNLHCASERYNVCESCHLIWLLSVVEELAK